MRYGVNTVQQLLSLSDMAISLTEAATTLNISRDDAEALVERAYKISNIINTRDKLRFIKADPLERIVLTPLQPQEQRDYRLLPHLNTNGSILRAKSNDDWQWFMKTCYQKISVSKAYISFPKSKVEDFKRFIGIATQLLPAKNWLINTDDKLIDTSIDKDEYQGMRYQQNLSVSTFRIGIASREVRDLSSNCVSTKNTWKYSPLFRFFIHMMLIMDDSLTIGEDEP